MMITRRIKSERKLENIEKLRDQIKLIENKIMKLREKF